MLVISNDVIIYCSRAVVLLLLHNTIAVLLRTIQLHTAPRGTAPFEHIALECCLTQVCSSQRSRLQVYYYNAIRMLRTCKYHRYVVYHNVLAV
jgi:hypothetical protein